MKQTYPVCIDGKHAAPPEDCGGALAYMESAKMSGAIFKKSCRFLKGNIWLTAIGSRFHRWMPLLKMGS